MQESAPEQIADSEHSPDFSRAMEAATKQGEELTAKLRGEGIGESDEELLKQIISYPA